MSKIFKRYGQAQEPLPKGIKADERSQEENRPEEVNAKRSSEGQHKTSIKISSALNKELDKERFTTPNITHLYDELLSKARNIYSANPETHRNLMAEINPITEKMIESMLSGNDELLLMVLRDYAKPEDLFYCHVVNITIIALAMGPGLGYDRSRLLELGVAAFVHDIGSKDFDILNKPDIISDDEFDKVKRHPDEGAFVLSKIDANLGQKILNAVSQEHERADGSGYPKGLVSDEISEYAQIIGLADVYEALMHNRPYRAKYTSLDTIRIILKNKKVFSRKVVKALIEVFGIFPIETMVQLNTKEIGVVVKRNAELISRPVIDVIIDSYGKEMKQPKRINLADNPVIYIDNCVKQEEGNAEEVLK